MENNNNEHNQIANSSEQESRARENEYFGLQLKNLSNELKTVGQQIQLRSESLMNFTPVELEFSMQSG